MSSKLPPPSDKTRHGAGSGHRVEYATRVRPGLTLRVLDRTEFLANLEACVAIYAAAMNPPAEHLSGRYTIMERHAGYGAFRAVATLAYPDSGGPAGRELAGGPGQSGQAPGGGRQSGGGRRSGGGRQPGRGQQPGGHAGAQPARAVLPDGAPTAAAPLLVGFAYGFRGAAGQWWHDLVSRAAAIMLGARAADEWFGDSLEIAEVHVHPGYQGQGAGLAMMRRLTADRMERVAVLSTMDADTRARRLYRGLGFTDLLTGFEFPGADLPYAIMGAPLPLPELPGIRPGRDVRLRSGSAVAGPDDHPAGAQE